MLLSRRWLLSIADGYAVQIGLADKVGPAREASQTALNLLRLMPWHLRFAVWIVECAASCWCLGDRLLHLGKVDPAREMRGFEKVPVLSPPLLKLYRSLVAISWFEHPAVLDHYGVTQPETRQENFRRLRNEAA